MKPPRKINWELARLLTKRADALEDSPKDSNRQRLLKTIVRHALDLSDSNALRLCLEVLARMDEIESTIQDNLPQDDELSHDL
jgi:hypothetical protein